MRIILARHGNTFAPGDPVVWAGAKNDLPLVAKGLEQAEILAQSLASQGVVPSAVYCAGLKRTHTTAQIITQRLGLVAPIVDERLMEIDYGNWSGLSSEQITKKYGADSLRAWDELSQWPNNANWGGSPELIGEQVSQFLSDLRSQARKSGVLSSGPVIAVTSNGRLRYFTRVVQGEFERRIQEKSLKVATGHVCILDESQGIYRVESWNVHPSSVVF